MIKIVTILAKMVTIILIFAPAQSPTSHHQPSPFSAPPNTSPISTSSHHSHQSSLIRFRLKWGSEQKESIPSSTTSPQPSQLPPLVHFLNSQHSIPQLSIPSSYRDQLGSGAGYQFCPRVVQEDPLLAKCSLGLVISSPNIHNQHVLDIPICALKWELG